MLAARHAATHVNNIVPTNINRAAPHVCRSSKFKCSMAVLSARIYVYLQNGTSPGALYTPTYQHMSSRNNTHTTLIGSTASAGNFHRNQNVIRRNHIHILCTLYMFHVYLGGRYAATHIWHIWVVCMVCPPNGTQYAITIYVRWFSIVCTYGSHTIGRYLR